MIMAPMQRKAGDSGNDGDDDLSIWLGGDHDVKYNDDKDNDDCDDDDDGVVDGDDKDENNSLSI